MKRGFSQMYHLSQLISYHPFPPTPAGRSYFTYSSRTTYLATTQPMRSHHNPEFLLSLNRFLFKISLLPSFPYKSKTVSFVLWTCCGSPYFACSKLQFLCYFQINSFLLVKELAILFLRLTLLYHELSTFR